MLSLPDLPDPTPHFTWPTGCIIARMTWTRHGEVEKVDVKVSVSREGPGKG